MVKLGIFGYDYEACSDSDILPEAGETGQIGGR